MVHSGFSQVAISTNGLDISRVPEVPALGNRFDMVGFHSAVLATLSTLPPIPIKYQLPKPLPSGKPVHVSVCLIRLHTCVSV